MSKSITSPFSLCNSRVSTTRYILTPSSRRKEPRWTECWIDLVRSSNRITSPTSSQSQINRQGMSQSVALVWINIRKGFANILVRIRSKGNEVLAKGLQLVVLARYQCLQQFHRRKNSPHLHPLLPPRRVQRYWQLLLAFYSNNIIDQILITQTRCHPSQPAWSSTDRHCLQIPQQLSWDYSTKEQALPLPLLLLKESIVTSWQHTSM